MALARWQRTIVDDAGNVLPLASIEVRSESTGNLAALKSDRAGAIGIANPMTADANGFAAFYVTGGAYRITASSGAFSITWRHVPIGTMAELDSEDASTFAGQRYTFADETTSAADPGTLRADNANLAGATTVWIAVEDHNGNDQGNYFASLDAVVSAIKGRLILRRVTDGREVIYRVTDVTDLRPTLEVIAFTVAYVSGASALVDNDALAVELTFTGDKGDQGIQGIQGVQGIQGIQGVDGPPGGLSGQEVIFDDATSPPPHLTSAHNNQMIVVDNADSPAVPITVTFDPVENLETPWLVVIRNDTDVTVTLQPDTSSPPSNLINGEATLDLESGEGAIVWCNGTGLRANVFRNPSVEVGAVRYDTPQSLTAAQITQALANIGAWSTGDAKLTLKTTADSGWLMMNDGTIGSASSGATYANAAAQALFTLLFNNINDTNAPIFTSAGAGTTRAAQTNAATAWANNCRMSLTKQLGRSLAVAGAGSGLTSRALGATAGAETETPTIAKTAAHAHPAPGGLNFGLNGGLSTAQSGTGQFNVASAQANTASAGSGNALNILDPSAYWNVMIKL